MTTKTKLSFKTKYGTKVEDASGDFLCCHFAEQGPKNSFMISYHPLYPFVCFNDNECISCSHTTQSQ